MSLFKCFKRLTVLVCYDFYVHFGSDVACQRADWVQHKMECAALARPPSSCVSASASDKPVPSVISVLQACGGSENMLRDVRLLLRLLSCPRLLARALSAAATESPLGDGDGEGAGGACVWTTAVSVEGGPECVCGAGHVLDMCSGGGKSSLSLDPEAAHESAAVVQLIMHILSKVSLRWSENSVICRYAAANTIMLYTSQ